MGMSPPGVGIRSKIGCMGGETGLCSAERQGYACRSAEPNAADDPATVVLRHGELGIEDSLGGREAYDNPGALALKPNRPLQESQGSPVKWSYGVTNDGREGLFVAPLKPRRLMIDDDLDGLTVKRGV